MAASAVGLVLAFTASVALADAPPNGTAAAPTAAAEQQQTTDTQTQEPGTPGDSGSAAGASGDAPSVTTVVDGLKDAAQGTASTDSSSTEGDDGGDDDSSDATDPVAPSATGQSANAGASADQTGAENGNVSTRVGQGGDNGTVGQQNDASADASSSTNGNVPGDGNTPGSTANAGATQNSPSNTNVEVRVDSPGNTGNVDQSNSADANAASSGNGSSEDTGTGGVANADASQTNPGNVNVIIRVGSQGDNGTVTQQNTAGASAGSTPPSETTTDTPDPSAADQAVETSSQGVVGNEGDLGQDVDQQIGDDDASAPEGPAADGSTPTLLPQTTTGTATTTQTGAHNTNVSIRVASPGTDGLVTQANTATALGTLPELGIVTTTGASNTDVSIVLPGSFTAPAGSDPWTWNWVWNGDWSPTAGATADDVASTATNDWTWTWQNDPAATATPATDTPAAGTPDTWTWTWRWTNAGGTTTNLIWQRPCACSWTWTWTWDWSNGAPTSTPTPDSPDTTDPSEPATPYVPTGQSVAVGSVEQRNDVSATADAQALMTLDQSTAVTQEDGLEAPSQEASTSQSFLASQVVIATATAEQSDALNLNVAWGTATGLVAQTNEISAGAWALASLDASQAIEQHQTGASATEQAAIAAQSIGSTQVATADARATQDAPENVAIVWAPLPNTASVGGVEQSNAGAAIAGAEITLGVLQWIVQVQQAGAVQAQVVDAEQTLATAQAAVASATVAQLRIRNRYEALVLERSRAVAPAWSQLNYAHTESGSFDDAISSQSIFQRQQGDGEGEILVTIATQDGVIVQTASASAAAAQVDLLNLRQWVGPTPPPDPAAPPSGDTGDRGDTVTPTTGGQQTFAFRLGEAPEIGHGPDLEDIPAMPHTSSRATTSSQQHVSGMQRGGGPLAAAVAPKIGSSVLSAAVRVGSAEPLAAGGAPRTAGGRRGPEEPMFPFDPFSGAAGTAPGGSAPSSGGGPVGFPARAYKFAAPAQIGPQVSAPGLGRPVAFRDPFERPG